MKLLGIEYLNKIKEVNDEIFNDILNNINEVINRRNYYRRKYRCQLRNMDVHVGVFRENYDTYTIQIYSGNKNEKIRQQIIIDERYNVVETRIKKWFKNENNS